MKIAGVLKKAGIHLIFPNLTWLTILQKAFCLFNRNYTWAISSNGHILEKVPEILCTKNNCIWNAWFPPLPPANILMEIST